MDMVSGREIANELNRLRYKISRGNRIDIDRVQHVTRKIEQYKIDNGGLEEEISDRIIEILEKIEQGARIDSKTQSRVYDLLDDVLDQGLSATEQLENIDKIDGESNVVFLFGAGASHASGIPLVSDLLTELVE